MKEELEALVGAERFARVDGRRGRRNGTYVRGLLTSLGQIAVTVPRARAGGTPRQVLRRYQRRTAEVDALLSSAYVNGVADQKAGELTTALMGERVSRSTLSWVAKLGRGRGDAGADSHRGRTPASAPGRVVLLVLC